MTDQLRFAPASYSVTETETPGCIGVLEGLASVYGRRSLALKDPNLSTVPFEEEIMPGAFTELLAQRTLDVLCLFNHDTDNLLGRFLASRETNTLRLWESEKGLHFAVDIPDTHIGGMVRAGVQRGDLVGCSFDYGNFVKDEEWSHEGRVPLRQVKKVSRLWDVGPVSRAAYPDTEVQTRATRTAAARMPAPKPPVPEGAPNLEYDYALAGI